MVLYGGVMTDTQRAVANEDPTWWGYVFKTAEENDLEVEDVIEMDQI